MRRRSQVSSWVLLAAVCVAGCGAPSAAPTPAETSSPVSTASVSPTPTVGSNARIVAAKKLSGRSTDLTIESPAVDGAVRVRLLLPADFEKQPDGTHNWVYWERELHRAWPVVTNKLEST